MAKLGWLGSVALAVGAGAGAAAAQFGLGYGFGVIAWSPAAGAAITADNIWLASLAWTLWIAATSTVIGAIAADRRSAGEIGAAPPRGARVPGEPARPSVISTAIWRALLAVAASIGALLSVALVLAPAHNASRLDTSSPHLIAAGYAIVGVVIGIVLAVCALAARAAVTNIVILSVWLWLLAAATVVVDVVKGRGYVPSPLEGWPFGDSSYFWHNFSIDLTILMLGSAVIVGVGAAWTAAQRGDNRVGVVLSGGAGPLLVAAAYVLTAPALVGVSGNTQASTSVIALCGVLAGLAGSGLLVAALAGREASLRERAAKATGDDDLDTVQLRKPSSATVGGGAAAPASPSTTQSGVKPGIGSPSSPGAVPGAASGPVKATAAPKAKATATAPAPRQAPEDTTERITTSPKRDSEPGASGNATTAQRPMGGGSNMNAKKGRRR